MSCNISARATRKPSSSTTALGVTLFFGDEAGPENVLKWEDLAMYRAKEGGRNRVHFYGS